MYHSINILSIHSINLLLSISSPLINWPLYPNTQISLRLYSPSPLHPLPFNTFIPTPLVAHFQHSPSIFTRQHSAKSPSILKHLSTSSFNHPHLNTVFNYPFRCYVPSSVIYLFCSASLSLLLLLLLLLFLAGTSAIISVSYF